MVKFYSMQWRSFGIGICRRNFGMVLGSLPLRTGQKTSKRNLKKEISPIFQQPERSNSDSIPDSSTSGNEYRALRRKYLLLEEESFALGKELKDVVDEALRYIH
ncbi:hypothetical protein QQP08_013798 [Theobroma cacao]|nr:hypothetical protein QQP08_013798 [Theobroma cacao]